ncbi:MAG: sulfatase [Lentisphaeraceae bacterium]|nr:sulfatase [Lentisphaeraceae bacterium]
MRHLLILALLCSSALCANKPNVILILADDLGITDTTVGGSKYYQTPNFEKLAARGVYFTNAYTASPLCSPTRASILTGQSPARNGITTPNCHGPEVILEASVDAKTGLTKRQVGTNSATRLDTKHETLGKVFKKAGYKTAHFGKWHLGKAPYSPLQHGFDIDLPHWAGPGPAGSYVAPWKFKNFKENYPKEHIEDRMGDEVVKFLEANKDEPFFINYWQFSVHGPFDAKEELIQKYRKTLDPQNPQNCPTYAAMIESFDDNIGKVLNALDRLNLAKDTIIVFYSDNGGNMYNFVDGTTVTSNAPFRGGKASMYEGGVKVPAVVVWPGKTKAGSTSHELIQSEDLYKTILEMTGLETPIDQGQDSISFVPVLKGGVGERKAVYTYFPHSPRVPDVLPPSVAVRQGDWKLIRLFHDNPDQSHRFELYNLKEDIGERQNVTSEKPELVRSLDKLIDGFLIDTQAVTPLKNPNYKGLKPQNAKGWQSIGYVNLSAKPEGFQIRSFGETPMKIQTTGKLNVKAGDYRLVVKLRSLSARGQATLSWSESQSRDLQKSTSLDIVDDGLWHEHTFDVSSADDIEKFQLQPADTQGVVHIEWLKLITKDGRAIKEWSGVQAKAAKKPKKPKKKK